MIDEPKTTMSVSCAHGRGAMAFPWGWPCGLAKTRPSRLRGRSRYGVAKARSASHFAFKDRQKSTRTYKNLQKLTNAPQKPTNNDRK
jgi:hypothetical protein